MFNIRNKCRYVPHHPYFDGRRITCLTNSHSEANRKSQPLQVRESIFTRKNNDQKPTSYIMYITSLINSELQQHSVSILRLFFETI